MHIKLILGCLLCYLSFSFSSVNAQSKRYSGDFLFLGGASVIDDSFTSDYNPFSVSDRWNFGYYLGTEMNLNSDFSVQLMYANNFYTDGTIVDGRSIEDSYTYQSFSVNASYNLQNTFRLIKELEPYVLVGMGTQFAQKEQREIMNLAVGTRYWFLSSRYGRNFHDFAIDFRIGGVWILPRNDNGRLVHATLGISYRLSK